MPIPNTNGLTLSTTGGNTQTLTCNGGGSFANGFNGQFTCNTQTGQWGPSPTTVSCQIRKLKFEFRPSNENF